jgi:hypothetical protein
MRRDHRYVDTTSAPTSKVAAAVVVTPPTVPPASTSIVWPSGLVISSESSCPTSIAVIANFPGETRAASTVIQSAATGSTTMCSDRRSAAMASPVRRRAAIPSTNAGCQFRASAIPSANQHAAAKQWRSSKLKPFRVFSGPKLLCVARQILLPFIAPVAVQHVVDLQPEHRYCLLMEGLRKHIHHMQLVQPVAGVYHCL